MLILLIAYDPIQPMQTRSDWYPGEAFAKKGGIGLSRKWIPGYTSVLHIKVSLLQRENTKQELSEDNKVRRKATKFK